MLRILRIELTLLLRGRAVVMGTLLLLLAGVFALVHGRTVIARQQAAIAAL